jgi:hypothetical protein
MGMGIEEDVKIVTEFLRHNSVQEEFKEGFIDFYVMRKHCPSLKKTHKTQDTIDHIASSPFLSNIQKILLITELARRK